MIGIRLNHKGFSLIELCVAMAIASVVVAAIYSAYRSQLGCYVTQQTIVDMQQNARAGMYLMEREIRLAGYNPMGSSGVGIDSSSDSSSLTFTMDLNDDGDVEDAGEKIRYAMAGDDLGRADLNSAEPILQRAALNLDALNFVYLDEDGDTTSDNSEVRSVQITLVARAGDDVPALAPDYVDQKTYRNQLGDVILDLNDYNEDFRKFRRFLLTTDVKCRNLGLE